MDVRFRYKVPDGLRPLLEALARETLRSQPDDVIRFAQLFFDELQLHRKKNPNTDIIGDPVAYEMFRTDLQRRYSESEHEPRCASPLDEAATKIQAAFRGHVVRTHPEKFGVGKVMSRTQSHEKMQSLNTKKDLKRHSPPLKSRLISGVSSLENIWKTKVSYRRHVLEAHFILMNLMKITTDDIWTSLKENLHVHSTLSEGDSN
ncbi:unnamed protein product [Cylicocyclus nassatus]|uniref:RIIa domain-containing protein n=1 Tax=Cylicocyclus nassatus TaxID=53992 RepID=A0AA36HGJ8_CYLNA|nr:unnamed protein product [Cylicocyclus nassatus]